MLWTLLTGTVAKLIGVALIAGSLGGGYLWLRTHYYNIGYKAALAAVAAQDKKAVIKSQQIHKEVDECFKNGGIWNVERDAWGHPIGCEREE
jgi:hypothetical protein